MSSSEYLKLPSFNWKTAIHKTDGEIICELRSQTEKQAERIKELEAERGESQYCAGCNDSAKTIERQSAALKLAREAFVAITEVESGTVTTSYDMRRIAIAAIDAIGE